MDARFFALLGGIYGFLSVAAGAFGAHALRGKLSAEMLAIFETAARYQMYHAIVLLVIAFALSRGSNGALVWSGIFFSAGVLIFSGSLYILTLSGIKAWGAVTPIGGLLLLLGWASLIAGLTKTFSR